jgi:hypothetical protein
MVASENAEHCIQTCCVSGLTASVPQVLIDRVQRRLFTA